MKRVKQGLFVIVASMLSVAAFADVIGASASITYWDPDTSGSIKSGGDKIYVDGDLNQGDDAVGIISLGFEHPIPLLPNVRFQYFNQDESAHGSVDDVSFKGQDFDGAVQSNFDFDHYDLTMYYEILDNWVNIDVGINAKVIDGSFKLRDRSTGVSSDTSFTEVIPMVYGSTVFELPITSLSIGVQGSGYSLSGDSSYDVQANVRYRFGLFGIETGYRALAVDIDDIKSIDVDTKMEGPYLSAMIAF